MKSSEGFAVETVAPSIMDFRLDDTQLGLQETIQRLCASRAGLDRIGEREGLPIDRTFWNDLAQLGTFSLLLPERNGGAGLGVVEAAVVFEQLGSYLTTGPLTWTLLAASHVAGAATGDLLVGGIDEATTFGDDRLVVEHAADLDALLVLRSDGVFLCAGDDLTRPHELAALDPLTPVGRFDALPEGDRVGDAPAARHMRIVGTALSAATLLGVSARALEVARTYALEREQFGVPIGSFQAVKHILADMYVRTVMARSAVYAAAAVADDPVAAGAGVDPPERAVAIAKFLAGEAAIANASAAIQVLGGMGFTWEMLPHYLLKRAWVLEHAFGTSDTHALTLATALERDVR